MFNERPKFESIRKPEIKVSLNKAEKKILKPETTEMKINKAKHKIIDLKKLQTLRADLGIAGSNKTETDRIERELNNARQEMGVLEKPISHDDRKIIFPEVNKGPEVQTDLTERPDEQGEKSRDINSTPSFEKDKNEIAHIQKGIDFWNGAVEKHERDMNVAQKALQLTDEEFKQNYGDVISREAPSKMYERSKKEKEEAEKVRNQLVERRNKIILGELHR